MFGESKLLHYDLKKILVKNNSKILFLDIRLPLWGTASNSNIEILQKYQNKVLRAVVNVPWYISNKILHTDLKVPTIRDLNYKIQRQLHR
jgi:hypothetical protein